ncbi:MAG: hypothetical protein K2P81_01015 [Bacteriovoracaceae bacterium]|nr:hypothetical protein [Bacteriovoracaceae bacterium]
MLGSVLIGGGGEYMNWVQATDPSDNSDLSGNSLNLFGAVGVGFNRFLIIGKYIFQSTYNVSKKDTNGDKTTFYEPSGGYAATLVYRIGKSGFINTEFNSLSYSKKSVGSTKTSLNSDEKMIFQSIAFGFGIMI